MYYTYCSKKVVCPWLNAEITLRGKYRFLNDEAPCVATFVSSECPVLNDQDLQCPYGHGCEMLSSFKSTVNISEEGYSQ